MEAITQPVQAPASTPAPAAQPAVQPAAPASPAQPDPAVQPAAPTQPAPPAEVRSVPLTALEKMREEMQTIKASNQQLEQTRQMLTEQLALYRANAPQPVQPQAQPQFFQPQPQAQPQNTPLSTLLEGVADDGLVEAGQVRNALKQYDGYVQQQVARAVNEVKTALMPEVTQLRLAQEVPDYKQLIETHLPPMINNDPGLVQTIKQSPNPLMTAVKFAKMRADMLASAQAPSQPTTPVMSVMDEINAIIANQAKPGNPGLSQGAINPISAASAMASMSEKDFKAMVEEVKRGKKFF